MNRDNINKKLLKASDKINNMGNNEIGVYVGNIKIKKAEIDYFKQQGLIFISPNMYRQGYVDTWVLRKGGVRGK